MPYCDRCARPFPHNRALQQHIDASLNHWACDDCGLDFATERSREQHYIQSSNHHYCRRCGRHCNSSIGLASHCRAKHHYCESCDRFFENEYGLEEHFRKSSKHQVYDSDSDEDNYYCSECKRSFVSENNLRHVSAFNSCHDYSLINPHGSSI